MRLTRQQLNEIVKEEIFNSMLKEGVENKLYDVSMFDLLEFGRAYASLGAAMQEQLLSLANDPGTDANPGAVRMIEAKLGGINAELDKALKDWHESYD